MGIINPVNFTGEKNLDSDKDWVFNDTGSYPSLSNRLSILSKPFFNCYFNSGGLKTGPQVVKYKGNFYGSGKGTKQYSYLFQYA